MLKTCITWHSVNLLQQLNILITGKHLRFAVKWKPACLSQENNLPRLSQMSCAKSSLFSGHMRHRKAASGAVTGKMIFYSYSADTASDGATTVDSSCIAGLSIILIWIWMCVLLWQEVVPSRTLWKMLCIRIHFYLCYLFTFCLGEESSLCYQHEEIDSTFVS
jgi:hypothetical protein